MDITKLKMATWLTLVILGMVTLLLLVTLPSTWGKNYHYRGIAEVSVEQALQLELEQGKDSMSITTYNSESDGVYITYDFWSRQSEILGLTGDRSLFMRYFYWIIIFLIPFCWIVTIGQIKTQLRQPEKED